MLTKYKKILEVRDKILKVLIENKCSAGEMHAICDLLMNCPHLVEGGFLYGSQLYKFEDIDKMPELGRINLLHNIKKSTLAMDGELYRALKQLEYVKDE